MLTRWRGDAQCGLEAAPAQTMSLPVVQIHYMSVHQFLGGGPELEPRRPDIALPVLVGERGGGDAHPRRGSPR